MSGFRQNLIAMIRSACVATVRDRDTKYGRQLATLLEKYSLALRGHHGGQPLWALLQETKVKLASKKKEKE
jgi:hypothetical protein